MVGNPINEMPDAVVKLLSHVGKTVVIATVDNGGWPNIAPIAWVVAKDKQRIRMAVGAAASTVQNIYGTDRVGLYVSGDGIAVGIKGRARVLKEPMASLPFPSALVEIVVEAVEDKASLPVGVAMGQEATWDQRRQMVSDQAVEQELLG